MASIIHQKQRRRLSAIGVCHLCGYRGQTRSLSLGKNGYLFLRYLPPADGARPITDQTSHVQSCHLCALLLNQQKELNQSTTHFFFKGFFRSNGACLPTKLIDDDEEKQKRRSPPPLRKASSSSEKIEEIPSFQSIRSEFLSSYQSVLSSSSIITDSCQLCCSVKPPGTLYRLSQSQFPFFSRTELDLCTLCYYNLLDQYRNNVQEYRRPRPECYLCHRYIDFYQWETKLFETDALPFLLKLHDEEYRRNHLYDQQRLALACDHCFFPILFQYLEQERQQIPLDQRCFSWQSFYSPENEQQRLHEGKEELFYSSKANQVNID